MDACFDVLKAVKPCHGPPSCIDRKSTQDICIVSICIVIAAGTALHSASTDSTFAIYNKTNASNPADSTIGSATPSGRTHIYIHTNLLSKRISSIKWIHSRRLYVYLLHE